MSRAPTFFPYDPLLLRLALFACAVASAALAASAVASVRDGGGLAASARAVVLGVLLGAFVWAALRVRPRPAWGVTVDALGVTVARPLAGEPIRVVWSQIAEVNRAGRRRERLALVFRPEGRLVLHRRLFRNAAAFDAMARAFEDRVPLRHDA